MKNQNETHLKSASDMKISVRSILRTTIDRRTQPVPTVSKDLCVLENQSAHTAQRTSTNGGKCEEKVPYDPHSFLEVDNPTSFCGTVLHVMMIIAGPGLLSIPIAFVTAGYVFGVIMVPAVVLLYAHNAHMMMWSEYELCKMKRVPSLPYPQVVYHAFKKGPNFSRWLAKWSRRLSYVEFMFVWFSYYCYNYVIIGQNLQVLTMNIFHRNESINVFLVILFIPLVVLSWIPKLKYLVPFSLLGSLCNFLSLVFIVYFVFKDPSPWNIPESIGLLSNIPMLVGTLLFNLNIAGIMIPLKNEMKKPRKFLSRFGVLVISFVPTSVVQVLFPLVCALKYGDTIRPSVAENLPRDDIIAQTGILLSSVALLAQQPLFQYVPFDILWNNVLKVEVKSVRECVFKCMVKTLLVILSLVVSLIIPDVFLFLSFSGTVGTSIDSLLYPALVHTIIMWRICQNKWKFRLTLVKNMVIIFLALILIVTGCYNCIYQIICQ